MTISDSAEVKKRKTGSPMKEAEDKGCGFDHTKFIFMGSVTSVAANWGQIFELDIGEQNMCGTRNAATSYLLGSQQFNQSFSFKFSTNFGCRTFQKV